QEGRAMLVDRLGSGRIEQAIYIKIAFEFQMRPVVKRIAHGVGNRVCPLPKLVKIRCAAGDKLFIDAQRAHGPPLVVIALQPYLRDIFEATVFQDILLRKVTMVINDWKVASV